MCLLEVLDRELLRRDGQLLTQFPQGIRPPILRPVEQDLNGLDLLGILSHKVGECSQIIFRFVFFARCAANQPLGLDYVLDGLGNNKRFLRPRVVDQQIQEAFIT